MATGVTPLAVVASLFTYKDPDSNASSENNITGAAPTIYQVDVDNRLNTTTDVYSKLYDNAAPTVGTTVPNMVIATRAGEQQTIEFTRLDGAGGATWQTGLSTATVDTPGTPGVVGPVADVVLSVAAA